MSLCNTFRLLAVSVALVVSISNINAFTFGRTTTLRRDLIADESRATEITRLRERPTTQALNTKKDNDTLLTAPNNASVRYQEQTTSGQINKTSSKIIKSSVKADTPITTNVTVKIIPKKKNIQTDVTTTRPIERFTSTRVTISDKASNATAKVPTDNNMNKTYKKTPHLQNKINTTKIISNTETTTPKNNESTPTRTIPPWKKYTFINRNRLPVEDIAANTKNKDVKTEVIEIAHSASSLQDTITSVIPSLEKLKNDLLLTNIRNYSQNDNNSKFVGKNVDTTKSDQIITDPTEKVYNEHSKWSVESKRAGFLDYSEKNKQSEIAVITSEHNETMSSVNPESPSHQIKDSPIKEMLLKESVNVDDKGKVRDEQINKEFEQLPTQIFNSLSVEKKTSEDKLESKSTSIEKSKNASLYTVSPNYKPLKKLEVLPPKPFIRDPDDNSWRNESISSLGIVFKPKNSSKPFTQVLKNKTETEWNSLSEKERKNDIPDLRERLEQMAKMRKTKRKKIDAMGNVVYVDYEENSTSNENSNSYENSQTPYQDNIMIPVLNFDPQFYITTSKFPITTSSDEPEVKMDTTTYDVHNNRETTKLQTRKPKKNFNIPDYYDSTEDDELDYLNLAKIDIKKYTQKTTEIPTTSSTWPIINYKTTKSDMPERKATVQYFPPTTRKAKLNKYNNPVDKGNLISANKPTTNPVPYPETATPANGKLSQYHTDTYEEPPVTNKPTNIDTDIYVEQPPRENEPAIRFKVINDEGNANRGAYYIKSYEDYTNDAEKDNNFDRNVEFGPQTEATIQNVMADELVKEEKIKGNFNDDLDYDTKFRKDVLNRFVDNFNRNSARFKSEFPIIFNSSIIHESHDNGREVASSRAFLRGLHGLTVIPRQPNHRQRINTITYDANQENLTVELEPTYEFHYFLPEQDEKEDAVPPDSGPLPYKL